MIDILATRMRMYLFLIAGTLLLQDYQVNGRKITCGRSVIKASYQANIVTSPGFPFSYPNNIDCEWIIQAPEGHQVEIVFMRVLTESCCDIIELRDGNSSSAGLLATYRGGVTESVYASSFGSLHIRFTSDDSYVDYGFLAEYRIATTRSRNCTMNLEATNDIKVIRSPGWPIQYENNLLCSWSISAPEDRSVEITFTELETEACCDYVLVRHGNSMSSPIFEMGGRVELGQPMRDVSPGNLTQVLFRSDSSVALKGFTLEYRAVDREKTPVDISAEQDNCGGKIEVPSDGHGLLTTPRYPEKHANNLNCVWVLVAPPGKKVILWFTSIDTEVCCDFIKIRDGETPTSKKLGILSGDITTFLHYKSTGNVLRVDFQSDLTTVNTGFRAVYEVLKDSSQETCGGMLRAAVDSRNYLSSPNWPKNPQSLLCEWRIIAPDGYSILFRTIGFQTKRRRDRIQFFDGASSIPFATMRRKMQDGDESFYTSSNILTVVYRPDATTEFAGFRAYYMAVPKRDSASYKTQARPGTT